MSNFLVSLIRTVTPAVAGWLAVLLVKAGFDVTPETINGVIYPVMVVAYYSLARFLEGLHPRFGFLLGVPKQPTY